MAQQTAVEWSIEQIEQHLLTFGNISLKVLSILKKEAKAIEKEQLKNAYWNGTIDISKEQALAEAEDFYNSYYNI